ncbi:MAG: DUF2332 domain-containing protein [Humibacillus sp.]|nr:DUF2332 domain-containing protein [Humibacillus sp.]MDN5777836.1 DUF2332 domain-containing protein [Humibacillus sp.]
MTGAAAQQPTVREVYQQFAQCEAAGQSVVFEQWAAGVAADPEVCAVIDTLPGVKRQPNLVFAAARWHGLEPGPYGALRRFLLERWNELVPTIMRRRTQTNEAGRCAQLVPLLASLPQPLALIEVGASAGLTLVPDRYSYAYHCDEADAVRLDPDDGPSPLVLHSELHGIRPPSSLPLVVWRAGVDLDPIDPRDPDARAWLETLVWPGEDDRLARLRAALDLAAADPVPIVRGDLLDELPGLVAQAPAGATLVVFHSAVIVYLDDAERQRFRDLVTSLPCRWVSNEGATVFPDLSGSVEATRPAGSGHHLLSLDGVPVGWAQGHGRSLTWLSNPLPPQHNETP